MTAVPLYVRSSDITGFKECEMKWWLNHLYAEERDDAIWFLLGTAVHSGIEQAITDELDVDEARHAAWLDYQIMASDGRRQGRGMIEQRQTARTKRGIATVEADIHRMVGKWFDNVHPDGKERIDYFDELEWPPIMVEKVISTPTPVGVWLHTTVDAVFQHGTHEYVRPIVDWKSGATAGKAKDLQLWTYQYGGRLEGWIDEAQKYPGVFVHLDHGKLQHVSEYPGDATMARWVYTTRMRKAQTLVDLPLPFKDWWCNYCPVRPFCPQEGEGTWDDVQQRMNKVTWVDNPNDWSK